jgi:murein DD-endopeptidase MepM/ murein hydrolase activator NlpD
MEEMAHLFGYPQVGVIVRACALTLVATLSPASLAGDCLQFSGELQQGGFIWGRVPQGSVVTLDGRSLDVLPDGTTFAGFGRDAAATAQLVVEGPGACSETLQVALREYNIQRVEGVPAATVNPPQEQLDRIRREGAMVKTARARRLQRPDLLATVLAGFVWPVEGPISGVYGSQRYYNGEPRRPHFGVDVAAPEGATVRAPAAGVVTLAQPDLFFSGGTVILDHGFNVSSTFLHMSEVLVQAGDELQPGDIIGAVGATGRATGPHLDWRMNWREVRIDPQLLAPAMPKP